VLIPIEQAAATIEGDDLVVRYRLANPLDEPIYVLNRRRRSVAGDGDLVTDYQSDRALVCHEHADTALLFQGPAPASTPDSSDDTVGASLVAPHTTVEGVMRTPLPLHERSDPSSTPTVETTCQVFVIHQARLRIAFLAASQSKASAVAAFPDVYDVQGEPQHHFEAVVALPGQCELQRRMDGPSPLLG
jgi:hypothetical protein